MAGNTSSLAQDNYMESYIKINEIQVQCNIPLEQIHSLSIKESMASHTIAELTAGIESGSLRIIEQQLSGQPLVIEAEKDGKKILLFSGVICQICIESEAVYETVYIKAYSLSWLLDLEKKNRSYQGDTSIIELIQKIGKENSFSILCYTQDQKTTEPFIQYRETDWEFLVRLSTHLHVPFYVAGDYEDKGLFLGFQEQGSVVNISPLYEKYCVDAEKMKAVNHDTKKAVYCEVMTGQILHLGQCVQYQNNTLRVFEVSMFLECGVLHCISKLAGSAYYMIPTIYNPHIKGVALKGTVLKRQNETVKVHLDIDDEQDVNCAYDYPWFPEYGNVFYCMPEKGSEIRLLIAGEDERTAVGIDCAGWNSETYKEAQVPSNRWFSNDQNKKMIMRPFDIELSGEDGDSKITFNDSTGQNIKSCGNIMIQANGKIYIQGTKVHMNAPQEITAIKREVGEPAVVNICHNMDAVGKQTSFNNLEELRVRNVSGGGKGGSGQQILTEEAKMAEEEKRKKLRFEMQELLRKEKERNSYELGDSIINIISAIPQCMEQDELSRIAVGFRPIIGRMKGE